MIVDENNLSYNKSKLDELVNREQHNAKQYFRQERMIYVFAIIGSKLCSMCDKMFSGKIFLLYDGRAKTRYDIPQLPNPYCLLPSKGASKCRMYWSPINPNNQYLIKNKQFFRSCNEYVDTWKLVLRSNNENEWNKWISKNNIILYEPQHLYKFIKLSFFERICLNFNRIRIRYTNVDLSLSEYGLISLIEYMAYVQKVLSGFGGTLNDLKVDLSDTYKSRINFGKFMAKESIQKYKYQTSQNLDNKLFNGTIGYNISTIDIIYTKEVDTNLLNKLLNLSEEQYFNLLNIKLHNKQ